MKQIYFTEARMLSDLFNGWMPYDHEKKVENFIPITEDEGWISSYCNCLRTSLDSSMHVLPNRDLIEFIRGSMLYDKYETIYFEIVQRSDGILVMAKNNFIIGGRWLALLPINELDSFKVERPFELSGMREAG